MTSSQIARQTLADQVVDRIIEAIVTGEFPAGSAISENQIALKFGVSRGPAREAILRIEARGLATRSPHLGARVVDLTLDDLRSLFEIREGLEGMAARLAAERMSDADLEDLAEKLDQHAAQPQVAAGEAYYQPSGDRDFHFGIAVASRNQRLVRQLFGDLYQVMRIYRFRSSQRPGRALEAWQEHRAILDALATRDPAKAEDAMRSHIRSSWRNTEKNFPEAR